MSRIIGLVVGLVVYGKTKNIWYAGVAGAISMTILEVIIGAIRKGK
ncbi:MAG: hypothetical protein KKD47_03255 [Proteobacteria bacterium]|nr:hypothetical protein [Pseudomonadota bacterium]